MGIIYPDAKALTVWAASAVLAWSFTDGGTDTHLIQLHAASQDDEGNLAQTRKRSEEEDDAEQERLLSRLRDELATLKGRDASKERPARAFQPWVPKVNASGGELFEACRADAARARGTQPQRLGGASGSSQNAYRAPAVACADGFFALTSTSASGVAYSCCPDGEAGCAGCASWAPTGNLDGRCTACQGGYTSRDGKCVSCMDTAGWVNAEGATCPQLHHLQGSAACSDVKVRGLSTNQVCCFCGGGQVDATPFKYAVINKAVGQAIDASPEPRTAALYSVDEKCGLAEYGLTFDGSNGRVTGTPTGTEPVEIKCTVTAHQTATLEYTATMVITTGTFVYESDVLMFNGGSSYAPSISGSVSLSEFTVTCAPAVPWLTVESSTGLLQRDDSLASGASGMLTTAGDDIQFAQPGGTCFVEAKSYSDGKATTHSFPVTAVKLMPWSGLLYQTSMLTSTIGDVAPMLKPETPADAGDDALKPTSYTAGCTVLWPQSGTFDFSFDVMLGAGMLEGHKVFELRSDGSIAFAPAGTLSDLFDLSTFTVAFSTVQKRIQLECSIYGHFPTTLLAPVSTKVTFDVKDDVCFIQEEFVGQAIASASSPSSSVTSCRRACRADPACSHFNFDSGNTCYQYTKDGDSGPASTTGSTHTAYAKVTSCNEAASCINVTAPSLSKYMSGRYCPVGQDAVKGIVYKKIGRTDQETLWLVKGTTADCGYELRQVDATVDYIHEGEGAYDLQGTRRGCLPESLISGIFGALKAGSTRQKEDASMLLDASTPKSEVEVPESEVEAPAGLRRRSETASLSPAQCQVPSDLAENDEVDGVSPIVVDSPSTAEVDDFWLHPCDCVPPEWGINSPVTQMVFDAIPANSGNVYIPPPFMLAEGTLVCDVAHILDIHYESAGEVGESCEKRCKNNAQCNFFVEGLQRQVQSCRLYSACETLVVEHSMEAKLYAVPRTQMCHVVDPEKCWKTTLRRKFLTSLQTSTCASHTCGSGLNKKPLSNLLVCGHEGEVGGTCSDAKCCTTRSTRRPAAPNESESSAQEAASTATQPRASSRQLADVQGSTQGGASENELAIARAGFVDAVGRPGDPEKSMDGVRCGSASASTTASSLWECHRWTFGNKACSTTYAYDGSTCECCPPFSWSFVFGSPWKMYYVPQMLFVSNNGGCGQYSGTDIYQPQSEQRCAEKITSITYRSGCPETYAFNPSTKVCRCCVAGDTGANDGDTAWSIYRVPAQPTMSPTPNPTPPPTPNPTQNPTPNPTQNPTQSPTPNPTQNPTLHPTPYPTLSPTPHPTKDEPSLAPTPMPTETPTLSPTSTPTPGPTPPPTLYPTPMPTPGLAESVVIPEQYSLPSFHYLKISSQCDHLRLMGGAGVQTCTPPTYASPTSHQWSHKRLMPKTFSHGEVLKVSCWAERYAGASEKGATVPSAEISCVNGEWYNKATGHSGLNDFGCAKCVQVTVPGYSVYQKAKKQELLYAARIKTNLYADGLVLDCVLVAADGTMSVGTESDCQQFYMKTGTVPSETRMVHFAADTSTCVVGATNETTLEPTFVRNTCNASSVAQRIKVGDVHKLLDYLLGSKITKSVVTQLATGFDMSTLVGSGTCAPQGAFGSLNLGNFTSICHAAPVMQEGELQLAPYADVSTMMQCSGCDGYTINDYKDKEVLVAISSKAVRENLKEHAANLSVAWRHALARAVVDCKGRAVTSVSMTPQGLSYMCSAISGLGACIPQFGNQFDVEPAGMSVLSKMPIECPGNDVIGSFHFEQSDQGRWVRWRYTCCKAGGVPTVLAPVELDTSAATAVEGKYCPAALDRSGRLSYVSQGLSVPKTLVYDPVVGAWCVDGDCVASKSVEPVGIAGPTFEVNEITDFDMEPGAPSMVENVNADIASLRSKKKSSAPPTPSKPPNLLKADFTKPEWQPEYENTCKFGDFKDLNPSFFDQTTDKYGKERLRWHDSYNGSLATESPQHPCAVANNWTFRYRMPHYRETFFLGGGHSFSQWAKTLEGARLANRVSDKTYSDGLTYESIFQCTNRQKIRWLQTVQVEYGLGLLKSTHAISTSIWNLLCSGIPSGQYSPMGFGMEVDFGKQCQKLNSFLSISERKAWEVGLGQMYKDVEDANAADCDPTRDGIARLFCDLLCVRDSVVRSEKNLRRVVDQATHITNSNLKTLSHWKKDEMEKQMAHLGSELDSLGNYVGLKLDLSDAKLTQVSTKVGDLLNEVSTLAAQSSVESSSRASARRALQNYVDNAEVFSNSSTNATQYAKLLEDIVTLHASVKAGAQRSQTSTASLKLMEGVRMQQDLLKYRMKGLGFHRKQGQATVHFAQKWSVERTVQSMNLVEMDKVWWRLRDVLDEYLEQAENSMATFHEVFDALASYQECSAGITQLLRLYNRAMESHEKMHQKLEETWKKSSRLLGELSAIVADSEVFASFMAQEGCESEMAKGVVHQYGQALVSVHMLLSYYSAAGMPEPSTGSLVEAADNVRNSFQETHRACLEG